MRAVIVGAGAVGARAARQLLFLGPLDDLVIVDADPQRASAVVESLGAPARSAPDLASAALEAGDVVLLGLPGGLSGAPDQSHLGLTETALDHGAHVVSVSDDGREVRDLLTLDHAARAGGLRVLIGTGFSPGLACVLAALAARSFERVEEIHVAKVGTGGDACARQQERALADQSRDWRDGHWEHRRGGSGRELRWFPDPVGGVDCFRAALPEPALLVDAFPEVNRVTARLGASRRARLRARSPSIRRPPAEDELGAVRVEVRGAQGAALDDRVLGAVDRPAVAAGTVAALAARWVLDGRVAEPGASGLARRVEPGPFLAALAERGVKVAVFEGSHYGDTPPVAAPT